MTLENIFCFVPCSKHKVGLRQTIKHHQNVSANDFTNNWNNLLNARNNLFKLNEKKGNTHLSHKTPAISLYVGPFFKPFLDSFDLYYKKLQEKRIRVIVLSPGYGLIDLFEPIFEIELRMEKNVAEYWIDYNLDEIICDFLLTLKPSFVFGFFAGNRAWSKSRSKYRYFFTEGLVKANEANLKPKLSGCFYRIEGLGTRPILSGLGKIFIEVLSSNSIEKFVNKIENENWNYQNIKIGFQRIK